MLDAKRVEGNALAKWRHLIGRASGESLVALVVAAMNVIFDGGGFRAEQRDDTGLEDFWIVDGSGSDFALVEAKGISGGIARAHVSQVDSHREARVLPPEFPGMLVVNAFRNDADLSRKQGDEVVPNVISLAKSQNVVVLRTWDLYQLLGRKLDGGDTAATLVAALADPKAAGCASTTAGRSCARTEPRLTGLTRYLARFRHVTASAARPRESGAAAVARPASRTARVSTGARG
jgi:hypothetical protein